MAGVRRPRPSYPLLQLSTAMATLAFFVVLGADLLSSQFMAARAPFDREALARQAASPPAAQLEAEQPVGEVAVEAEAEGTLTAPPPAPAGTQVPRHSKATAVAEFAAEPEQLEGAPAEAVEEGGEAAAADGESAGYRTPDEGPAEEAAAAVSEDAVSGTEAAEATAEKAASAPGLEAPEATYFDIRELDELTGEVRARLPALRLVEILLGATAILLGSLTLRARRNR